MSDGRKQRVLVLYGGDNATLPRAELIAWLATTTSLNAAPTIVADDVPHSAGSVNDRVTAAIDAADKAIALVTRDPRSEYGAPNVVEEIGRWIQGKSAETLCVVREDGTKLNSNMQGPVYLGFKDRIKEAYEGIRKFLEHPVATSTRSGAASDDMIVDASNAYMLLDNRVYRQTRVEDTGQKVTAILDCDGPAEAALRALNRRARVELTFGNHVARGSLDDLKITHEGSRQLATIVVSKRDDDALHGHMSDAAWGGANRLSADEIATLRASRLLTGEPTAMSSELFGPEMLIRGGMHDGIIVEKSPIPAFLAARSRRERETWEHLRLELVRQLILSRSVERIEFLRLTVEHDRLVHIVFRGVRHQYYSNVAPHVVAIDKPVSF